MADIDTTKNVYLFTHGREDLIEKSTNALVSNGFSKDKIIMADPAKAGEADDYMAMDASKPRSYKNSENNKS